MKSENFSEIIRLASISSVALPLILYFVRIKSGLNTIHKIGGLVILSAASDLIALYLFNTGQSTVFLFNSYYLAVFVFLAWFYYGIFVQKTSRNIVLGGAVLYALSFVLITAFVQPYSEYQTFMWTITGVIALIFSISYFLSVFSAQQPMDNYGLLWINSGILFYFSFNLFLFVMSSYVLTQLAPELSKLIWSFHNINNIVKNILLALGMFYFSAESMAHLHDQISQQLRENKKRNLGESQPHSNRV
jgi:hypothetical protein